MKTLSLLRHAKSSWDAPTLEDFDRPLNQKGSDDARLMASRMSQLHSLPDAIICSAAIRAQQTASILRRHSVLEDCDFTTNDDIYSADSRALMRLIAELDDAVEQVLLIGHNPSFTNLLNALQSEFIDNMPTCSIAVVTLQIENWQQINTASGQLIHYDYPKK